MCSQNKEINNDVRVPLTERGSLRGQKPNTPNPFIKVTDQGGSTNTGSNNNVQEVDKPDLPQAQAAVTATPEPVDIDAKIAEMEAAVRDAEAALEAALAVTSEPADINAIIAEMEAAVRDAEAILDLATKHRDAAGDVIKRLGEEKAGDIVKAICQQLSRELAAIGLVWRGNDTGGGLNA